MAEIGNEYRILAAKRDGEKKFGRPRITWEDNIKMCLMVP
jgi:hypothetical protein